MDWCFYVTPVEVSVQVYNSSETLTYEVWPELNRIILDTIPPKNSYAILSV